MDARDEIDRILGDEPVVRPGPDFAARVMREVRSEARGPETEPLAFPWHRFLPGFLTAVTLSLATFMLVGWAADAGLDLPDADRVLAILGSTSVLGVGGGLAAAAGSLLAAWLLSRPGMGRRPGF